MDVSADASRARRVGCVSFINAKPLIEGLAGGPDPEVRFAVPAELLGKLEAGEVDLALCPVIDPAGGIGCRGTTLTVRLFSRVPIDRITRLHADRDSHTSVALAQVLLHRLHRLRPEMVPYQAREATGEPPESMLLIGDKVVTSSPRAIEYPHQLDLGEAWHELTGLPFVFAVWMARKDAELGDLPDRLARQRERNAGRVEQIARRYAAGHGWPAPLATRYLGEILRYEVGEAELEAIERFSREAAALGLIERARPLRVAGRDGL
ncbi:MAG: menaquinone biosynthetic enzyme MqnA/MqnD family protein [Phycisphaeraceae bacterium]